MRKKSGAFLMGTEFFPKIVCKLTLKRPFFWFNILREKGLAIFYRDLATFPRVLATFQMVLAIFQGVLAN